MKVTYNDGSEMKCIGSMEAGDVFAPGLAAPDDWPTAMVYVADGAGGYHKIDGGVITHRCQPVHPNTPRRVLGRISGVTINRT